MKPCNVVNCILRIKCSLNLLVSYVCFDIRGGNFGKTLKIRVKLILNRHRVHVITWTDRVLFGFSYADLSVMLAGL